jgi:hypothetical protein
MREDVAGPSSRSGEMADRGWILNRKKRRVSAISSGIEQLSSLKD